MTLARIDQFRRIAKAADALEEALFRGSGPSADWPFSIATDNEDDAERLAGLLQELREALKPYRRR